jgi:peptidyl-tRNA hydrolase, PTH1 family
MTPQKLPITAIIGLGNPGPKFEYTRHNVGFLILDALCSAHGGTWQKKDLAETSSVMINGTSIILIKPQTFMNLSGKVIPGLAKKGIKPENILVIHDELELPFGKLKIRTGGSAKGHNGLRSIIEHCGSEFNRLSVGISRPERKEDVGTYVLQNFTENSADIQQMIFTAVTLVEQQLHPV